MKKIQILASMIRGLNNRHSKCLWVISVIVKMSWRVKQSLLGRLQTLMKRMHVGYCIQSMLHALQLELLIIDPESTLVCQSVHQIQSTCLWDYFLCSIVGKKDWFSKVACINCAFNSVSVLRMYSIDTEAFVFMFNGGSSYGFTLVIHSNRLNHETYPGPCIPAPQLYLLSHTLREMMWTLHIIIILKVGNEGRANEKCPLPYCSIQKVLSNATQ